jgi:hypothetical protein
MVPAFEGQKHGSGRPDLRRRAANAGHQPGAVDPPDAGAARRAIDGPGTDDCSGNLRVSL